MRAEAGAAFTSFIPIATFLLTGGRAREVLGLACEDVDLENGQVHFRPNRYRILKRVRHKRWLPPWPQLREGLTQHMEPPSSDGLIFTLGGAGTMIRDVRGALESAAAKAEIEKRVTPHTFRHTYAATRLQTMDHGRPVSPYTVMRELGHSSLALIEKTYGHLLEVRHRSAVVEDREATTVPFRIDVRIALDVISLAYGRAYDVALVMSQDQDLSEVAEEIRTIAREQRRWIKLASAFPQSPASRNRRGINKTDWIRIDRALYDRCLDRRDYRRSEDQA